MVLAYNVGKILFYHIVLVLIFSISSNVIIKYFFNSKNIFFLKLLNMILVILILVLSFPSFFKRYLRFSKIVKKQYLSFFISSVINARVVYQTTQSSKFCGSNMTRLISIQNLLFFFKNKKIKSKNDFILILMVFLTIFFQLLIS